MRYRHLADKMPALPHDYGLEFCKKCFFFLDNLFWGTHLILSFRDLILNTIRAVFIVNKPHRTQYNSRCLVTIAHKSTPVYHLKSGLASFIWRIRHLLADSTVDGNWKQRGCSVEDLNFNSFLLKCLNHFDKLNRCAASNWCHSSLWCNSKLWFILAEARWLAIPFWRG